MHSPPGLQTTYSGLSGARRITFEEDSLFVEARDSVTGLLEPEEEIFWEEVRAVYLWTKPDWPAFGVGLILVFFMILFSWCFFNLALPVISGVAPWLFGLATLLLLLRYIIQVQPRQYARVVADDREILFHTPERHYIRVLLHRLGIPPPERLGVGGEAQPTGAQQDEDWEVDR
jgi:hypothetical protein